jgi:MFS family permease
LHAAEASYCISGDGSALTHVDVANTPANRNIRLLSWFNFCLDFRIYNAIAVIYFAHVSGSYALGIAVFSIAKISSAVFEVPTGIFSDYLGRKLTLGLGQLASALSIGCYALASSFGALAIGGALEGLSFALFSGNNDALLFETLKEEGAESEFARYHGRISSVFQLALAASAAVALVALKWLSFRDLFLISVMPQLLGLALTFFLAEPRVHESGPHSGIVGHLREALAGFVGNRDLRLLTLASAIGFALGEAKFLFYPAFFALFWQGQALAFARLLSHAGAALGFRSAGYLIAWRGERQVLVGTSAIAVAMGTASAAMANVASPALSSLSSLPYGPSVVAQRALSQKAFSDRQRATMASLSQSAGSLFFAVAALAIGYLADWLGPRYALLIAEILSISVTYLYWRLYGRGTGP